MEREVIIALDFPTGKIALDFVDKFKEHLYIKIGMELFYSAGPQIVVQMKEKGHKVFLDLKLHDIPNTVYGGLKSVLSLGADMVNIHCAGGAKMMEEARRAFMEANSSAMLIGVTMLTSTSDQMLVDEIQINPNLSMEEVVLAYAKLGQANGLDGVVCSAKEAEFVRRELGQSFKLVCPGVRPMGEAVADQVRVVTPEEARDLGVDYIVVGRPITQAEDPVKAYQTICKSFIGE